MIRILLKFWPALTIIILYCLWVFVIKKRLKKNQETEYKIIDTKSEKKSDFSLDNEKFVIILYICLILAIFSMILLVVK